MVLVPSYLEIDGLVVPLQVFPAGAHGLAAVGQRHESRSSLLVGLRHVTGDLLSKRTFAEVQEHLLARTDLPVSQELCASVVPLEYAQDFEPHLRNWETLTTTRANLEDCYHVGTAFLDDKLVIPRATLLELMRQLYQLNDDVRSGARQPKIDASIPLPPPRRDTTLPDELWDDDELEALERMAVALDELDPLTPALATPEAAMTRQAAEARAMVLRCVEIADTWQHRGLDDVRARAHARSLAAACAYLDAVDELRAYLTSPERLDTLATFPSAHADATTEAARRLAERPLDARLSVDVFRLPRAPHPPDVSWHRWLASCEGLVFYDAFIAEHLPPPTGRLEGDFFTRVWGKMTRLRYRPELGGAIHLWRIELE